MLGRIGIDVYLRNPNIVYPDVENANKKDMSDEEQIPGIACAKSSNGMIDGEVYRSDDAGETWQKVNSDEENIGGGPGYYYGQIRIDPNDDKVVHVLSASSWGTKDGGKTWDRRPLGFGGDDHALWIDPDNSEPHAPRLRPRFGSDLRRGENWYHPDNLSLAQFYAVGYDFSYPYRVAGGLQDNGSKMGPSTSRDGRSINFEDWERVGGGDGMYNEFDWKTNRYLYNESQFGPLHGSTWKPARARASRTPDKIPSSAGIGILRSLSLPMTATVIYARGQCPREIHVPREKTGRTSART